MRKIISLTFVLIVCLLTIISFHRFPPQHMTMGDQRPLNKLPQFPDWIQPFSEETPNSINFYLFDAPKMSPVSKGHIYEYPVIVLSHGYGTSMFLRNPETESGWPSVWHNNLTLEQLREQLSRFQQQRIATVVLEPTYQKVTRVHEDVVNVLHEFGFQETEIVESEGILPGHYRIVGDPRLLRLGTELLKSTTYIDLSWHHGISYGGENNVTLNRLRKQLRGVYYKGQVTISLDKNYLDEDGEVEKICKMLGELGFQKVIVRGGTSISTDIEEVVEF